LRKRNFAGIVIAAIMAWTMSSVPAFAQSLIRDAEIEGILRDFTDPILEAANLRPNDVDVLIINDPTLNAFVARGQNIHLHTGLILAAESPSQLIGVIAHETGHIEGGHNARRQRDLEIASRPAYVSIGLGLLAIAAGAPDAGAALIASSQQFAYLNFASHTRPQEASADQAALRYMAATGRSPAGLLEFFENFRDIQFSNNAERYRYFYTHPLASDRIESLRNGAERSGLMNVPDSEEDIYKLRMMQAKLYGFLMAPVYVQREYPESDQSVPARYARAISAFQSDSLASALSLTEDLITEEPENPYFYELKGQILFENGRFQESIEPNRIALQYAGRSPLLMVNLARSLSSVGQPEDLAEAEDLLSLATALEPGNAFAWHELAIVMERQGRRAEANLATAEQAFHYGDCNRAMSFASRAAEELEHNTSSGIRASDITRICSISAQRRPR
tara:strand:- start:61915 stop:63264 length:1350 start_codon:yes stop_codon:yes gene_type:complete